MRISKEEKQRKKEDLFILMLMLHAAVCHSIIIKIFKEHETNKHEDKRYNVPRLSVMMKCICCKKYIIILILDLDFVSLSLD